MKNNEILHFFGIHDWTKWEKVREGILNYETFLGQQGITPYVLQRRRCKICDKVDLQTVTPEWR